MQLVDMFFEEIEDAKKRRVPFILPIGTVEYHARHASCGTDTLVITGVLRALEQEKEIVVCPPVWYGATTYAVSGPERGTVEIDEDVYTNYIYCILKSLLYGGVKNLYCIAHHQTGEEALMPLSIACHKAAKKVILEYMEDRWGRGWWGSGAYADPANNPDAGDDPFSYIQVIPLLSKEAQHQCGGFDHAGKWETSLLLGASPEHVDLSRCGRNTEWFAQDAAEASEALGRHMVQCSLEWLRQVIV